MPISTAASRCLLLLVLSAGALPGCKNDAPPIVAGTADKPRLVEVKVSNQGFTPGRIPARAGEFLNLSFHYDKSAGECGREVVLPKENVRVTLSESQPVQVAVRVPPTRGEIAFTCGMNMLRGAIVVE